MESLQQYPSSSEEDEHSQEQDREGEEGRYSMIYEATSGNPYAI